jgi:hypothetical protein
MKTNVRTFKGPDFGITTILMICINLFLIFGMLTHNFLLYLAGVGLINLTYYLIYRNGMNYFLLTEDSLVVKNKWRLKFERRIPYEKIKSIGTYQILSNGPTLELIQTDDSVLSFNYSNVGEKKIRHLVSELTGRISQKHPV